MNQTIFQSVRRALPFLGAVAMSSALAAASVPVGLGPYYLHYGLSAYEAAFPLPSQFPPEVRVVGGATDPAPITTAEGTYFSVSRRLVDVGHYYGNFANSMLLGYRALYLGGAMAQPCAMKGILIPQSMTAGTQQKAAVTYYSGVAFNALGCDEFLGNPVRWTFEDTITYGAPVRRKASDGSEYDASPMVIKRGGVPWMTYYWGYRLGLVASESNWNPSDQSKVPMLADWPNFPSSLNNFELAKLPPPFIEGEIVEYVNYTVSPASPVGHFFYASNANEQALLDQIPQWTRTGRSFKSGGYVSVCRFYGSVSPGPNTHFYSADANECKVVLPGISALHDEGLAFRASRPIPATPSRAASCPTATIPLYRLYNNPAGRSFDSNHRYLTDDKIAQAMVSAGWVHEGLVMCVPQ
ncbi:MAG TPA: hypothetical protein PK586_04070 [Casimicrobium sp.]|nr:hypothetical protein [Casimicrobium sp.]